jgi:hypothetical protein
MRRTALLAVVAIAAATLSGCTAPQSKPTPKPLQAAGTITVPINVADVMDGTISDDYGAPCLAEDGYDDISSGAQVVITDSKGKTVGVGELNAGKVSSTQSKCEFEFTINGIPAGSKFYGIHVGNQNRGVVQEQADQIGNVQLKLGS